MFSPVPRYLITPNQSWGGSGKDGDIEGGAFACVSRWDVESRQSAVVNSIACPGCRAVNVPVALSVLMVVRATTDGREL